MIDKDTRVVAIKKHISTDLGGEMAILHLESGVYYSLNEAGARVWTLIQGSRLVNDVLVRLVNDYEVEPEKIERDLFAFLEELRAENLIQVENGTHT